MEIIPLVGAEFENRIKTMLGNPLDLRFESVSEGAFTVVYLASLINPTHLQTNILAPLAGLSPPFVWEKVLKVVPERGKQKRESLDEIAQDLIQGRTVAYLEGHAAAYSFETLAALKRQPSGPHVERTIHGPRLSFVENLFDNIAMIRSLIRDPSLRMDGMVIGRRSQTKVAVMYLENVANPTVVAEVHRRLRQIDIDDLLATGYLEQLITDNRWSIFPLTQSTERPDKVAAGIMEGRVALFAEGSCHAVIVPATVNELYQSPEDYYFGFWFGSFLRFFRILGNNLAVALPGLYLALVGVNPELLPVNFTLSVSGSTMGVAFPLIIELLVMEITVEIFREASLRLPVPVSQTLGVTAGIILGIASVGAGLVSNATLVVVIITAIASYSGPDYSIGLSWRILKYVLIFGAAFLGMAGLVTMGMVILGHAAMQKSFGINYLAPWSPLLLRDLGDTVIRKPLWQKRRTGTYQPLDPFRYQEKSPAKKRNNGEKSHE